MKSNLFCRATSDSIFHLEEPLPYIQSKSVTAKILASCSQALPVPISHSDCTVHESHLHHHSSNTKVLELYYLPCSHALHNKDSRRRLIVALDTVIEPLWASKLLALMLLAHLNSLLEIVLYWTISRCVPIFESYSGIVRTSRLN